MSLPVTDRSALRRRLLNERDRFVASAEGAAAAAAMAEVLRDLLHRLEPQRLGLYWPVGSEFNAASVVAADRELAKLARALPFARRLPPSLDYRHWDGLEPTDRDECGIPSSRGDSVAPDVVLAPCVGYSAEGYRLGYGGGFFDRWLALHPDATAVGVAWSVGALAVTEFAPQAHDRPLTLVVTERGVI